MITGVILAGGRNSRMHGYNKAMLPFKGESIIEGQIRVMGTICQDILVVTPDPDCYANLSMRKATYLPDVYAGHGPLSGMHAAFLKLRTEFAWVVGCDYPTLSVPAAQLMVNLLKQMDYDAVIPIVNGKHQMLHGVYRPERLLSPIVSLIEGEQYRLSGLLDMINWLGPKESDWLESGISHDFTLDIDTPEQYLSMLLRN